MAIPPSRIIDLATPLHDIEESCIRHRVRERLWTWGLGHDHLDEHLQQFSDPQGFLTDDAILVFPQSNVVEELSCRDDRGKTCLYNGRLSFEYIFVAIDPIMKAWGRLPPKDWDAGCLSIMQRANSVVDSGRRPIHQRQLMLMEYIYRKWSWVDVVPSSFLSADSDQTMVEPTLATDDEDESEHLQVKRESPSNVEWDAFGSAFCREPKRRLLPEELARSLNASEDGVDDDSNASSVDSYLSRDEADSDAYEADRRWLEDIQSWAVETSNAEKTPVHDGQIPDDSLEQPPAASSLDLGTPDYPYQAQHHTESCSMMSQSYMFCTPRRSPICCRI
ncbi:hypothetical protein R3P38DRAFT_3551484 [Favolaschia claudopus]|uniref:Uncharacterized protein n=1 Tax=Favolaschia claudopus TaxID=2862362 RepID=A0AAW0B5C9_9AGAR